MSHDRLGASRPDHCQPVKVGAFRGGRAGRAKVKKKLEIDPLHADTVRLIYRVAFVYDDTTVFTVNLIGGGLVDMLSMRPDAARAKRARGMWRMPQPPGWLRTTSQKYDSLSHNPEGQADQS